MFLKTAKLKNFRSFEDSELELQKDLTILVGENNGGKSNAIDAIRLLTPPLGGRREIYCESTDVRFPGNPQTFELEAHYAELSPGQQGRLISAAIDETLTTACFGLQFDTSKVGGRPTIWAGRQGNAPEAGCLDMIRHVYLPPLRDAKWSLASGNPTRIMALLNHFLDGTTPAQLAKDLARSNSHNVLSKIDNAVAKGLSALTAGVREQTTSLGFAPDEALIDIARDLRFKLADHGVAPEDLRYSGHGYANLLFMAIITVELEKVRTADLTLFLVEEPEAHLHPHLQAAVLAFLQDQAELSRKSKSAEYGPAGELQVVVATHSPNLSAWVSSDRLVVFKSIQSTEKSVETPVIPTTPSEVDAVVIETALTADQPSGGDDPTGLNAVATAAALRRSTRCISLAKMPLDVPARRKIDRYLDVTKAALLFGGRVLLVEGIAEALLLPAIAKHHVLKNDPEKLRIFRSVVFVPIDGVDFAPYVRLLLTCVNGARIAERVVVLTDGDKGLDVDEEDATDEDEQIDQAPDDPVASVLEECTPVPKGNDTRETGSSTSLNGANSGRPGERRREILDKLAKDLDATHHLSVLVSTYSLETELIDAGNSTILRDAYLSLHPRSRKKWENSVALQGDERAKRIHNIFKKTRKGDFAQLLSQLIEDGNSFTVPLYIRKAIEQVVLI